MDKRYANGLSYQVAYTWSRAIDESDGWFGVEGQTVQDPYHPSASYGLSGTNMPNVFSANGLYQIPVGPGKRYSTGNKVIKYHVGNWQLNNIFTWRDGQDFTASDSNDRANIGGGGQRADQVGNPHLSNRSTAEWFNTAAFALPPLYTFGNAGRNTLRAQRYISLDTSVIRAFPFWREGVFEFRQKRSTSSTIRSLAYPTVTCSVPASGSVSGTANNPRQMQFSGKIVFLKPGMYAAALHRLHRSLIRAIRIEASR